MAEPSISPIRAGTLKRVTEQHPYFANWASEQLKEAEGLADLVNANAGAELIGLEDLSPYSFFLIDGRVRLRPSNGVDRVVNAGDLDARFPLAHLRPSRYSIVTETPCTFVRLESSLVRRHIERRPMARFRVDDVAVGGSWRSHPLVVDTLKKLRDGSLSIPSVPGIAMRIRRAIANDDYDMDSVAAIIGADPAIAGRLIKIANSAVFKGQRACESVKTALFRLGIEKSQNIVFTLATKSMYKTSHASIKKAMIGSWRHAVEIASLCAVLGKLTPSIDTDRALLVGLLHEIGAVPIFKLAEGHPDLIDKPSILTEIQRGLVGEVSAEVLRRWEFSDDYVGAAREQSNWLRDHEGEADYTDLVVVAHLHALVRHREFEKLPRLDETPAFDKLALGMLSPQLSMKVLDESNAQIKELQSLLS